MWDWLIFLRDRLVSITDVLNNFTFNIANLNISLLDLILGFIFMGMIISIFWKGART